VSPVWERPTCADSQTARIIAKRTWESCKHPWFFTFHWTHQVERRSLEVSDREEALKEFTAIKSAMMNGSYVKAKPATALAFGICVWRMTRAWPSRLGPNEQGKCTEMHSGPRCDLMRVVRFRILCCKLGTRGRLVGGPEQRQLEPDRRLAGATRPHPRGCLTQGPVSAALPIFE
jgi:hypothetical protein